MPVRTPPSSRARTLLAWAWTSVAAMFALLVATFIASNSLTQIVSQILGPLTIATASAAVWFGLAARRKGEDRGLLPAGIGGVVGGFFLVMLMLSLVIHLGFGWE